MATSKSIPYQTQGEGEKALLFIHGFMDGGVIWQPVIDKLRVSGRMFVTLDLPGMGDMNGWTGKLDLHTLADAVVDVVDAVGKPMVIVGHSMGCQVAELVAVQRPDVVEALILLTPIPLIGLPCDQETTDNMHNVGQNAEMQRGMRIGFSPDLPADRIDALVATGMKVSKASAAALFDAWSGGVPEGKLPSPFQKKVAAIGGETDPFASPAVIAEGVAPRFRDFSCVTLEGASHWPHVSQPGLIADKISDIMAAL